MLPQIGDLNWRRLDEEDSFCLSKARERWEMGKTDREVEKVIFAVVLSVGPGRVPDRLQAWYTGDTANASLR